MAIEQEWVFQTEDNNVEAINYDKQPPWISSSKGVDRKNAQICAPFQWG